jgi:hypothetical protein
VTEPETKPASRREVYLTVALAVAQGLPEPWSVRLYDATVRGWPQSNGPLVAIELTTHADATAWAAWLGCEDNKREYTFGDSIHVAYSDSRYGWDWRVESTIDSAPVVVEADAAAAIEAALDAERSGGAA